MNALEAKDITKSFHMEGQEIPVLRGVSLALPQGAFHAVMGPSGSGKSTLMAVLAGLLPPDAGEVTVAGQSLCGLSDRALTRLRRRTIGIVFQDCNLVPTLTVAENIALPALLDGHPLPETRLTRLLDLVGLAHRRTQPADRLSGGEAQRTAIARAFAMEPGVILADEPTGNLDAKTGDQVLALLFELTKERHAVLAMVTHSPETAARCDRTLTLQDGVLIEGRGARENATGQ